MSLPDFIIIGAAKAGTTSLYALLDRHPDIFMCNPKEPEFFARDEHFAKGLDSYEALFEGAGPGQCLGEASTLYSHSPFFPDTAARIRAHVPDAKIIYVLRHPVDRAYSYYTQIIKNYQNDTKDYAVHRSFEEFVLPEARAGAAPRDKVFASYNAHLSDDPELCLSGSDYVMQAQAYLDVFPRGQILFMTFEAFRQDRRSALRQITDFLGLEALPDGVFQEASTTQNVSRDYFEQVEKTRRIQSLKRRFSWVWGLRNLLPKGMRHKMRQAAATSGEADPSHMPAPMLPATRDMLEARFAAQVPALSDLTGLDLSVWRFPSQEALTEGQDRVAG